MNAQAIFQNDQTKLLRSLEEIKAQYGSIDISIDVWDDGQGNDPETSIILPNGRNEEIGDNYFALAMKFTGETKPIDNYLTFIKSIEVLPSSDPNSANLVGPEDESIANFESDKPDDFEVGI